MADQSDRKFGPKEDRELHAMEKRTGSKQTNEASESERNANKLGQARVEGGERRRAGPPSKLD